MFQLNPMRLFFQLLEIQAVTVKNASPVMVTESPPSTSIEATSAPATNPKTGANSEQTGPSCSVVLGKKKLRDISNVESVSKPKKLRYDNRESGRGVVMGKLRSSQHFPSGSQTPRRTVDVQPQDIIDGVVGSGKNSSSENKRGGKYSTKERSPEPRDDLTEDSEVMEVETVSQNADSLEDEDNIARDASKDIEEVVIDIEGESSQEEHFILQEEQPIDVSEDLEEDDDEDRLRICDPEEVIEDRNGTDSFDETVEVEPLQHEEKPVESLVEEEEVEVVRKESKSRKKNKKAKHHHRHKRDYSPAPEATIVPVDKNDIMKLKLKLTRPDSDANGVAKNKQEDNSKHMKNNDNQKQFKHKSVVVSDDADNNSVKSLNNSNMDEDSRNSLSTDDHDARSVTSSKEGQDEAVLTTKETTPNGSLKQLKAKNVQVSNKLKLLQMRQIRHKNITPPPRNTNNNTTITKVTSEEASRNSPKTPIVLSSPNSSLTVSKVTAEERLKMMTNNNLESTQPSLEIIPVNKSNFLPKTIESKTLENHYKNQGISIDSPVVRLMKTNNLNSLALNKQQSLNTTKTNNNNESIQFSKDNKSKQRPGERRPESFGVLDLSKPARSTSSSPASEGSCPSPSQTTLSLTQPIIKRHVSSISSPHRPSSDSPPVPKGSPNRPMQYPNPSMYNLSVLSNAAVHLENKTQLAQEAMKRQQLHNQKASAPFQRYPGMSPTRNPVSRASPTQLKIPNPNVSLHNKFLNRPKLPNSNSVSMQNNVRPTRPMPPANTRPNNNFGGNMLSQSAAVAKKQAGINGRPNIPPPPAGIPISELYKMPQKYDLEKIARKLTAGRNAEVKGQARIPSSS